MAQIVDTDVVNSFVINRVPSQAVFDDMVSQGQINDDEMYLVEGGYDAEGITYDSTETYTSGTVGYGIQEAYDYADDAYWAAQAVRLLIAPEYNSNSSYKIGNLCLYTGLLYQCVNDTADPAGSWDPTYWSSSSIRVDNALYAEHVKLDNAVTLNQDYMTKINDGANYNTLTTPGNYYCETAASAGTMTNTPFSASAHRLIVMDNLKIDQPGAYRVTQIAIPNSTLHPVAMRVLSSGGWSQWDKISLYSATVTLTTSNMPYTTTSVKWLEGVEIVSAEIDHPENISQDGISWTITDGSCVFTGTVYDTVNIRIVFGSVHA